MNRKALDRLRAFYESGLGQDIVETGTGTVLWAGGQALFTDMSPEEIALSAGVGVGAAAIGRPLVGRLGQSLGTRIDKTSPGMVKRSQDFIDHLKKTEILKAKFAPYANLSPTAQLGQFFGRTYGDNALQGLLAIAAPSLFELDNEKESPR